MDVIEIREDVVPDERAHEIIVMNQVNPQHRPGDAVDHRAEEVRPRQEVKKQRNRQRDVQDHGKMSGFFQENILMQQKSHRVKGQYRHKQEQHHREETAQIAFMLPRLRQRGTVQPQITADGVNKGKKQDGRIREERHNLDCRQYRIAQEEQCQERLVLPLRQVRKEQILKRDEQREDDIAGNKPVAAKQDGQGFTVSD